MIDNTKDEEDDEELLRNLNFKPPDRSTSAPPIMSMTLNSNSLFAFRATDFNDIRCDENYFEFYHKHQNQSKLPPPLETQPSFYNFPDNMGDEMFNEAHFRQNILGMIHQQQQQLLQLQRQAEQQQQQAQFYQQLQQQQQKQQVQAQQQQHRQQPHHQQQLHHPQPQHNNNYHHPQQQQQQFYQPQPQKNQHHMMNGGQFNHNNHNNNNNNTNKYFDQRQQPNEHWTSPPPPGLGPLQRKIQQLTINENPEGEGSTPRELIKSSFEVAYSTVNQLIDDGQNNNNNGINNPNGGLPRSVSNSSLHSTWKDKAFEPQPRGGQPSQPQNNKPSGIHAPTPIAPSSKNLIGGDIESSFERYYNMEDKKPNNSIVPSRTPTPPNDTTNNTSPSQVCRYFTQGYCSRGSKCNFVHDEKEEVQQQQSLTPQQPQQKNNKNTQPQTQNVVQQPNITSQQQQNNNNKKNQRKSLPILSSEVSPNQTDKSKANNNGNNSKQSANNNQQKTNINSPPQSQPPSSSSSSLSSSTNIPVPTGTATLDIAGKIEMISSKQYTSVDQIAGSIYPLCRDQHGCRFLQKKLEEGDEQLTELIFREVCEYMLELMTDPFGNYLCQKLLEHCNDRQRLQIIDKVGPDIVRISMNMHGTRAVQKMIEFLTTPEQIALIKKSLANFVVPLIQDLNGNHVIQKCLNKLSPPDNQFIYDSVSSSANCIAVATHRHGCCVLQRCIDHASESQKVQLIQEVIANSLVLVQDPFGNYVVQYVLDLPFPGLTCEMAKRFVGHVPILATQKFSSNVVEKCLHVADPTTRGNLIQELIDCDNLLHLLQDPFANYVIQTSLTIAEPHQHTKLVEAIRPHLPMLKNTPYGKRIQNKIMKEGREYF